MRSLSREKCAVYISQKLPPVPLLDGDGNETGEYISAYDEPIRFWLNVKPITDIAERQAYGTDVNNIRKAVFTPFDVDGYEILEHEIAWIGTIPNGVLRDDDMTHPMNYNYTVEQVLDTGGQYAVFFKKVQGAVKA